MHPPPPLPPHAARGWWSRHWRWALPLALLVALALIGCCIGWALLRWSQMAHGSAPMREALRRAGCSIEVASAFGEPLQPERLPYGSMETDFDGRHEVGLAVGVQGPRGAGTLFVQGVRVDDAWDYPVMYVLGEDDTTFDLSALDDAEAAGECALQQCRIEDADTTDDACEDAPPVLRV